MSEPGYPGAVPPERVHTVPSLGLRLCVREWGDPAAPPVLLTHGFFDHGRGFDLFAPLLATRFRVLALDTRGHGDSEWADAYGWAADVEDIVRVLRWLGTSAHLVGHSRGGVLAVDAAVRAPDLVRRVVDIDGFGPPPEGFVRPGETPGERSIPQRMAAYLDRRRAAAHRRSIRWYPTLDHLAERRRRENPRLSHAWLRYFIFHGARQGERGWTWKVDPYLTLGFGPWEPAWIAPAWARLRRPLLAITGSEPDSWGPLPEPLIAERLAGVRDARRAVVQGAGHFAHMERPSETADAVLDFLT